jgi:hypothetical protein
MFCLESRSKSGFSVTDGGYRTIYAADRAPEDLVALSPEETGESARSATTITPTTRTSRTTTRTETPRTRSSNSSIAPTP